MWLIVLYLLLLSSFSLGDDPLGNFTTRCDLLFPRDSLMDSSRYMAMIRNEDESAAAFHYSKFLLKATSRMQMEAICNVLVQQQDDGDSNVHQLNQLVSSSSVMKFIWMLLTDIAATSNEAFEEFPIGHITEKEALFYSRFVSHPSIENMCEIGFNAGLSSVAALLANPEAHLTVFDLLEYPHSRKCVHVVQRLFPNRFTVVQGDSSQTIPANKVNLKCDVIRIDGGHLHGLPMMDLVNSRELMTGEKWIWMDDVGCDNWNCKEPTAAWEKAKQDGWVKEYSCVVEDKTHGFCWGRRSG